MVVNYQGQENNKYYLYRVAAALMCLCIAADEASAQIGKGAQSSSASLSVADAILINNQSRSLCLRVPVEKLGAVAKQHTPQRGWSIGSLSHHLSLYTPTEILASWQAPMPEVAVPLDVFNLLLLPWPTDVCSGDFRSTMGRADTASPGAGTHWYFDYAPTSGIERSPKQLAARIERGLPQAVRQVADSNKIRDPRLLPTTRLIKRVVPRT